MNINLDYQTSFWQYGTTIFAIAAGAVALIVFLLFMVKTRTRPMLKADLLEAEQTLATVKSKRGSTEAEIKQATEDHARAVKLVSSEQTGAAFMIFLIFAILGAGLIINATMAHDNNKRQDVINVRDAINETYDVSVGLGDAKRLMTMPDYNTLSLWSYKALDVEDNDPASQDWSAHAEYGTSDVLQENGDVVNTQLIRIKEEFRLVYTDTKEDSNKEQVEVDKRSH